MTEKAREWEECPYCHRDWRMPFTHRECVQAAYAAGRQWTQEEGIRIHRQGWTEGFAEGQTAGVAQERERCITVAKSQYASGYEFNDGVQAVVDALRGQPERSASGARA